MNSMYHIVASNLFTESIAPKGHQIAKWRAPGDGIRYGVLVRAAMQMVHP